MKPRALYLWTIGVAVSVALGACSSGSSSSFISALPFAQRHSGGSPIEHVIVLVQENRSFDNLFAKFPNANGATYGCAKTADAPRGATRAIRRAPDVRSCPSGDTDIKLAAHKLTMGYDLNHCHSAFELDYDGGRMDGFYLEGKGACVGGTPNPAATAAYQYVDQQYIKPYWDIAKQWVLADNMFQTQGSGSFTAHQDLIRGSTCIESCESPAPPADSESLVDNPTYWPWGCDGHSSVRTSLINIYGVEQVNKGPFPCSDAFPNYGSSNGGYETLRDSLDAAGVSWKYYTPCYKSMKEAGCTKPNKPCKTNQGNCDATLLNAFDVISPVRCGTLSGHATCGPDSSPGPEWGTNVSWPETNIFTDITNSKLPAVSWVIPADENNDHPSESTDHGPQWVASVVNAIGESPYWSSSVIIVVWDDWGGLYDHVAPQQFTDVNGGLGFRVPMLVISPYAIAGKGSQGGRIAHAPYEFGSILRYIEDNWNLARLGTTDVRATSIGNIFDYNQNPRSFSAIPTSENAQYFIRQPHTPQHGDPE